MNTNKIQSLAKAVLENEANAVSALIDRIDDTFVHACELMLHCKGRIVVMGLGSQLMPVFWKECVYKELQIVGSRVTLGDYPRALRLMELGKLHPDLLISEVLQLHELDTAFHLLEEKPEQYLIVLVKNT